MKDIINSFSGKTSSTFPHDVAGLTAVAISSFSTVTKENHALHVDLNKIEAGLASKDPEIQLEATRMLRILLVSERDLLIRQVIERNWTPRLISWLKHRDNPTLQLEVLWALTNISANANDTTPLLVHHGIIPIFVSLLDSDDEDVLEQTLWMIGNMACDGPSTRDSFIHADAISWITRIMRSCGPRILRVAVWTVSNLCDGQPRPILDMTLLLPVIVKILRKSDIETLSHACWTLSHLCDGPSIQIHSVVNSGACLRLVELLDHSSDKVSKPALRAIGNIVCAEDDHDYTQHVIECGAVPLLRELISHSTREVQKEACWTLSNIAAGTVEQIQAVLDSGSIAPLVRLSSDINVDGEIRSEACWVILNATSCGSDSQIEFLVMHGCIGILDNLLGESSMIMMALEGIERILQVGEIVGAGKDQGRGNPYALLMAGTKIALLQSHKSVGVAKRASRIWRQYFVTCALCEGAYSKTSPETFFCEECKCNVCKKCNCTVYHLDYQESLWREETEKESTEKQAKQQSKRNKRQKKRQRTKERKALLKLQQLGDEKDRSEDGHSVSASEDEQQSVNAEEPEDLERSDTPQQLEKPPDDYGDGNNNTDNDSKVARSSGKLRRRGANNQDGEAAGQGTPTHQSPVVVGQQEQTGETSMNGHGPFLSPRTKGSSVKQKERLERGQNPEDMMHSNDKLVSYLLETGSIMALAQRLDLEDDDLWLLGQEKEFSP